MPLVALCALVGSATAFVLGGLVGFVLGLRANPSTVWFAVFEVGVPTAVLGAALGAVIGLIVVFVQWISHRWSVPTSS